MTKNAAEINIKLDSNGRVNAVLEGTNENLLAMLTHCMGKVLQANGCCEEHFELGKLAIVKDILSLEVSSND